MKTDAANLVDDAQLTQALAEVMSHLRGRQYGAVLDHFEAALRGSADAFVDTLARHLLYEEEVLFPALRSIDSARAEEVRGLLAEHAKLRRFASELAASVKAGEFPKAYGVARTFLAELFDHIAREAEIVDRAAGDEIQPPLHAPLLDPES